MDDVIKRFRKLFTYRECNDFLGVSADGTHHDEEHCPNPFIKFNANVKDLEAFITSEVDKARDETIIDTLNLANEVINTILNPENKLVQHFKEVMADRILSQLKVKE